MFAVLVFLCYVRCIYLINFSDLLVGCIFDQLFVCCVVVYSYQLLVGSSYTVISYHDNSALTFFTIWRSGFSARTQCPNFEYFLLKFLFSLFVGRKFRRNSRFFGRNVGDVSLRRNTHEIYLQVKLIHL